MQKFQKIDKFANTKKSEGKFYINYVVLQRGNKSRTCCVPYCSSLVQPLEQDYSEMTKLLQNYIAEHLLEFSIDNINHNDSKLVIYNRRKQWLKEIQSSHERSLFDPQGLNEWLKSF